MINSKALAPHTGRIIEEVSKLDCLKPFVLVGGTALSIQLETRQSEDLDFMRRKIGPNDDLDINWPAIKDDLETVGTISSVDVLGFDQVIFMLEGVKISFYAAPRSRIPSMKEVSYVGNIRMADIESIGAMKMEALMRRHKFRDYYDIYSILMAGTDIHRLMSIALDHSGHQLKAKSLMAMLTNGQLFRKDADFEMLKPVYEVSAAEIEEYIKRLLQAV